MKETNLEVKMGTPGMASPPDDFSAVQLPPGGDDVPGVHFSHFDKAGDVQMVDVSHKPVQKRVAVAKGEIHCQASTLQALATLPKGDVLATARIAGIQAAKRTAELIPLCHALPLNKVSVDFVVKADRIEIRAEAITEAKTGVEMEALTAVSVAALTLYDMMKAVDKTMRIEGIQLLEKTKECPQKKQFN